MLGVAPDSDPSVALDYLFCYEEEAQVWCDAQDFAEVYARMAPLARVVCVTRSAKGCVVLEDGGQTVVPAVPVKALDSMPTSWP